MAPSHRLTKKGFLPVLIDSELMAMVIVAEYQIIDTDKGILQYLDPYWSALFPMVKICSTFIQIVADLWQYKEYSSNS